MSIEDDLRRSLQARANDVTPDPATFARVQTRIRRGRTVRLAFAGLATALAVAGVAVAAPRLIDRRIEFVPAPLATAPAPDETVSPSVSEPEAAPVPADTRLVFTDGEGVYAMALDGEAAEELMSSDYAPTCPAPGCVPIQDVTAVAGSEVTAVGAEGCNGLRSSLAPEDTFAQEACPTSVAFSPSTGHLAWISQPDPDGKPSLHTIDWTAEGPGDDDAGFDVPWDQASEVSIQDWIPAGDGRESELVLRGRRDDVIQLLRMPFEEQADGALGQTGRALPVQARPGFVPLAFAASGAGVEHTLEARQEPDGYADVTIVRRTGLDVDAEIAAPADLFENSRGFNESDLWMSDNGAAVVFGNTATGKAWYFVYAPGGGGDQPRALAATIRSGELVAVPPVDAAPATQAPSTTVEVDVYFGMEGADACTANQKVTRQVEGPGVARAAVTELLKGPSSRESNEGVTSPFSALTAGALDHIAIVDGQAQVDFADFSADVGNDSCTKSAIVDALNKTLKQFPTVTSTRYLFDGDAQAWEQWLGTGPESPPFLPDFVHETYDDILAAAQSRDWDALRRLSAQTSCTFSDQKEPCVPYWRDLEEQGEDPLGVLVEILQQQPALNPEAPIWVWPAEYFEDDYLGPRAGIRDDGVWMFYVPGGD